MAGYTFTDCLRFSAPLEAIYDCLWHVEHWPRLLAHVVSIEVLEQARSHHRFRMQTRGEGGVHTTETVRRRTSGNCISYEQVVTPALLESHRGRWLLEQTPESVTVTSEHTIEIAVNRIQAALGRNYCVEEAQLLCRHFIGNHSVKTLHSIHSALLPPSQGEANGRASAEQA